MITLYTFGPAFGLLDPSPFVAKAICLLRMSGLEHSAEPADIRKSPKGKLPYMNDNGKIIADSAFIKMHLETAHGVDFSGGYDTATLAKGWAIEKVLEDHLYWIIMHTRWAGDENFNKGPKTLFDKFPALMRPVITFMVRRQILRDLHGQGMSRHSDAEILTLAKAAFGAISALLGDKPYILGDKPCGYDATLYAFLQSALCPHFPHPTRDALVAHQNMTSYCGRLGEELFAEPKSG